jgi:hypothetical protein
MDGLFTEFLWLGMGDEERNAVAKTNKHWSKTNRFVANNKMWL